MILVLPHKNILYRSEIDGIRFFSIILVIFYHTKTTNIFNSGYLGVDIFFVISGYLITSIILNEYNLNKKFNLLKFIERRCRRIIPAIILVTGLVFIISILFFFGYDKVFKLHLEQIFRSIFFISNFIRYDYFAPDQDFKILFHTWSLSIEMQLYVFFSILFLFLIKFQKKIQISVLLILFFITAFLTQSGANLKFHFPFIEKEVFFFNQPYWANFYSPISRIFEFLFGVFASYFFLYLNKFENKKNLYLNNSLSFIGIFLILISLYFFNETTTHPSVFTLPTLLGTFLLIVYSTKDTILNKFFSISFISYFGKLSYSAYLFHVPILFLINFYILDLTPYLKNILLLFITFFFSHFSYNYVEKIFRGKKFGTKKFFLIILFSYLIINIFYFFLKDVRSSNKTLINPSISQSNLIEERNNYLNNQSKKVDLYSEPVNFSSNNFGKNKLKVLIIGNSISQDFFLIFDLNKHLFNDFEFKYFRFHLSNFLRDDEKEKKRLKFFLQSDLFKDSQILLISSNFRKYGRYSRDIDSLKEIKKISDYHTKKLILTSNTPFFASIFTPVEDIIFKNNLKEIDNKKIGKKLFKLIHKNKYKKNNLLKKFADENNVIFLDKIDYMCDLKNKFCDALDENNNLIHQDSIHISIQGAEFYGKKIAKLGWFKVN